MDAHHMFKRIGFIVDEVKRLDEENPTGPDEETDPRIVKLLDEAERVIRLLDPIVRETYCDNPAALAEWDDIVHSCDDIPGEEKPEQVKSERSPARRHLQDTRIFKKWVMVLSLPLLRHAIASLFKSLTMCEFDKHDAPGAVIGLFLRCRSKGMIPQPLVSGFCVHHRMKGNTD